MGYFLLRRLALVIPVLLAVSFVTFSLQRVEEGSTLRISSYLDWLGQMSQGDLGGPPSGIRYLWARPSLAASR